MSRAEPKFLTDLEEILQNIRQSKTLLENEVRLLELESNQVARVRQMEQLELTEKVEMRRQGFTILEKLSPASSDSDQWRCINRWKKTPSFGDWLFHHDVMVKWLHLEGDSNVIWLKGIPGCGRFAHYHSGRGYTK